MQPVSFHLGDTLILKKNHACREDAHAFTVARLGSDVKIICATCGHNVTLPRPKLEKSIRRVIEKDSGDAESAAETEKPYDV